MDQERIDELEQQVAALTELVQQMRGTGTNDGGTGADGTTTEVVEMRSSRRNMLRLAGAAAAGAAVSAVGARPAAAANGNSVVIGTDGGANNSGTALTGYNYTGPAGGTVWKVQDGTTYSASASNQPAVLSGWAPSGGTSRHGVYGYTQWIDRAGVLGRGPLEGGLGVEAEGRRADILLAGVQSAATQAATPHFAGDVFHTAEDDIWAVVGDGTPGMLRKLAGPLTAGSFHAVTPGRVYDSRRAEPSPGMLNNGQNRTISVADRRDLEEGWVLEADFVPAGATAVAANVSVVNTSGGGFLAINPGGVTDVGAAAINWWGPGQILNNGVSLTLNGSRELTVICGGNGATDFIIDIAGYYL